MCNVIRCQCELDRAEASVTNCAGGLLEGIGFMYTAEALINFEELSQVVPIFNLCCENVLPLAKYYPSQTICSKLGNSL